MQRRAEAPELLPLFDAVSAAPADDAPRQVLADALIERGDPRGEFIALQLLAHQRKATPAHEARARELQARHAAEWLADAPGLGDSPTSVEGGLDFHRGFLRSAVITLRGLGADSPVWRHVERLDIASTQHPGELASPYLERLEVLTGLDAAGLEVVLRGPLRPRLRELAVGPDVLAVEHERRGQRLLLELSRFPALTSLSVVLPAERHRAHVLTWLFEAPLAARLRQLSVHCAVADVAGVQAALVRHGLAGLRVRLHVGMQAAELSAEALTVRFANEFHFRRGLQWLRNLAPQFCPFPYPRFEVRVAERRATDGELAELGPLFVERAR